MLHNKHITLEVFNLSDHGPCPCLGIKFLIWKNLFLSHASDMLFVWSILLCQPYIFQIDIGLAFCVNLVMKLFTEGSTIFLKQNHWLQNNMKEEIILETNIRVNICFLNAKLLKKSINGKRIRFNARQSSLKGRRDMHLFFKNI